MSYVLTPDLISSVTDVECAFSTVRLLPEWDDIPDDFKVGNIYTELTQAILYGRPLPGGEIELNDGVEAGKLNRYDFAGVHALPATVAKGSFSKTPRWT